MKDPVHLAAIHASAFDASWDAAAIKALLDMPGAELEVEVDSFLLWRRAADEAEIVTLAVRPEARRRGLGGRLLDRTMDRARERGVTRLFLEVAHDNPAALGLYGSRGFEPVGKRPDYYVRPDGSRADALILALNLS
ncbi:GNAT family N-acetyltransferase [Brevundimonas sp.]|uniref:GNAT family N-acetyltransferase n=1 Tax=Brevundimonas sp. TaxID=1871086 RepID=UPI001DC98FD6|nr:GNAT family N-acetyltransferase [Brevundimonas sp.]MBA3999520.1 ribosomal-protein-alanine acetyltransferase [Brevundimonas sp.]